MFTTSFASPMFVKFLPCLLQEVPALQMSQKSNLAVASEATIRKSGRRSVPNRKYLDMEMDFRRKKSKTASSPEKKSGKFPEQDKTPKSQNSSASTLKRKLDLNTEKNLSSKKRAVKEPSENEGSPKKSVQSLLKTVSPKKKAASTVVSTATSPLRTQLPSPGSPQKIASPILKIASPQKSSTLVPRKVVQSSANFIGNNSDSNQQTQPVILVGTEQLNASPTMLTTNKNSGSVPNNSALSEERSENLTLFQTANVLGDVAQELSLPVTSSKASENFSKTLPTLSDSLSSSLNSVSNSKPEHIVVVHPAEPVDQQVNQRTDFLDADKNLSKELPETSVTEPSVPQIVVTLPNTISSVALQNSSLSNTPAVTTEGSMTYSVDMTMSSTKPIISFTEGISQASPYTVSLLNNNNNNSSSNKDKEAVESLINASHITEKVSESGSVMMCLSSGTEDLVPSTMSLDVNTHHDAHRLETEAAIQEITASFPQTFTSNDIVIHEKDQITKTSISLAEAAKMVAESQTIVDLPDVNSLSECGLEGLRSQPTPVTREVATTTLPTAVASTQTPLQLPRKSSKASSLMKNLTVNMQQSGKLPLDMDDDDDDDDDDDLEDGDCFDNDEEEELKEVEPRKSTQEFIVVHLPEGAQIKRERVDSRHQIEPLGRGRVDENGSYRCTECNYMTAKKANWYKHRKKHLGLRPHCCLTCDYKATTSSNLKRHMAIHADLREYKCNLCSNYFRQKIHLERHMKYKHEEKKVQCPLCNYVCASENPDLKIHFKRRHVPSTYSTMNSFTCDECGLHMMKKHGIEIVMNMKDDWSTNGYATNNAPLLVDKGDGTEPNIMTVGNVVTATSEESNQLMVVTEDADNNTMQTVITIEDLASSMTNPVKMSEVSVSTGSTGEMSDKVLTDDLNQQQHAADAVEGLQALAEHPRIVDHDNHFKCSDDVETQIEDVRVDAEREVGIINNEVNVVAEKNMSEVDEATVSVIDQLTTETPVKESFELTTDQVVHLSTGDYVEINGEVYKVEISTEPAEETVTTSGTSDSAGTELFETIVQNDTNAAAASFLT
ncbi:unnamed protein product [Acanthosepion pharaonis]|uniref:C2H2-type domain-containing protein n=1 Tax=Acanthosepion pharaonis TaxID=158019 RepID=A0A812B908_ACAPH|nr:unnamed protein product [Sepia pharaonis]